MTTTSFTRFDSVYRGTPRPPEELARRELTAGDAANLSTLLTELPPLLTQLAADATAWAGNPTSTQVALAVTDARALTAVMERIHTLTHKIRKGA